ncbi:conserved hypothetical protein [Erythrobacter sp. EC-HK427]|nr:conserved hypothetical protein [Erythrobacter sp. EC-HK427]
MGFLVGLTALAAVLGIIRFLKFNPRTRAGEQTLAEAQERASRLKSAPRGEEVGFAVALFGTAVLVGTPFEPLHAMRQAQQGGDSGGGGCGSDGGGDGGCGGGGCGGCGG